MDHKKFPSRLMIILSILVLAAQACSAPFILAPALETAFEAPSQTIHMGESYELKVHLTNSGEDALSITQVSLPATLFEAGTLVSAEPGMTQLTETGGKVPFDLVLNLGPDRKQTLIFTFTAAQIGSFSGSGSVRVNNQDKAIDMSIRIMAAEPTSPTATLPSLGTIPYQAVVQIGAMVNMDGEEFLGWTGSGTIISPDGYILTNAHVVMSDRFYTVSDLVVSLTLEQDQPPVESYYADIVQAEAKLDLAVIKLRSDIEGNPLDPASMNLPAVPLGNSDTLKLGDPIVILGYPGIGGDTITLTRGEVSGFTAEQPYGNRAFIKTSATIAGGNSGGLAVNESGEIIGIPTQVGSGDLEDSIVDCRPLADTNRDGFIDDYDNCVPTGGFINALRPIKLAESMITAARQGEVMVLASEEIGETYDPEGDVLFEDDFSDPESGWYVAEDADGYSKYEDGEFVISVNDTNYLIFSDTPYSGDNLIMAVDARILQSVGDGDYGLMCGYQDDDNFTVLEISEDGFFTIFKYKDDQYVSLVEWTYSDQIAAGGPFILAAYCGTDGLLLALDETLLTEVYDPEFVPGKVGLVAGTYDTPGFKVAFDNYLVMGSEGYDYQESGSTTEVVFEDDFSDENSGWYVGSDETGGTYYEDGELIIEVNEINYFIYSDIQYATTEAGMAVEARVINSVGGGDIGFICGYQDIDNFTALEISEDGFYSIWKQVGNETVKLIDWTWSDAVAAGGPYSLFGYCSPYGLILALDDIELASIMDPDFIPGAFGLMAGTYTQGGFKVAFDNYYLVIP